MGSSSRKFFGWTIALGLSLCLLGLLAATGESLRHAEFAPPIQEAGETEPSITHAPIDNTYHHPGLAAWMTP